MINKKQNEKKSPLPPFFKGGISNFKIISGKDVIYIILIVLLLLPVIFFPLFGDHAIYLYAGKIIYGGGKIYVDFIDLKPPTIYYLYTLIYSLTGLSEIAARIFDFLLQSATALILANCVSKITLNKNIGYLSGMLYALSYTSLGFNHTMQTESCAALPLVIIIYLISTGKTGLRYNILTGVLIGLITSIKYTLGIVLIAVLIEVIFGNKTGSLKKLKTSIIIIASSIFMIILSSVQLIDPAIRAGFAKVVQYLSYHSTHPVVNSEFIKYSLKETTQFFGDKYSLLLLLGIAASFHYLIKLNKKTASEKSNQNTENLLRFTFLLNLLLVITVALERKFQPYHFSRMYIPLSIDAAIGLWMIGGKLLRSFTRLDKYTKYLVAACLTVLIVFTPLPRWINLIKAPYYYFTNTEKYDELFDATEGAVLSRAQQKAAALYLNQRRAPGDTVIVISQGSFIINNFLDHAITSKFSQSCFYFGNGNSNLWENDIIREIESAKWIIIQKNDRYMDINGHNRSSYESLHLNNEMNDYVNHNFTIVHEIRDFIIFKRNNPIKSPYERTDYGYLEIPFRAQLLSSLSVYYFRQ